MKVIVYSPRYNVNSGGSIVLHKLCSMLQSQHVDAVMWYCDRPHVYELLSLRGCHKYLSYMLREFFGKKNKTPYEVKQEGHKGIKDAIVVYPEIYEGNPLFAKNVVRWFLNKPGQLTGKVDYGDNELYFYYSKHFNDWKLNPYIENHLNVIEMQDDIYNCFNKGERSGSCYMVRKGRNRVFNCHNDAICIDGLDHKSTADIFNKKKYFISYDLYTMYSRYAAICGCIPIVVPEDGLTKEQWRPEIENRYGIAYGFDDIGWAIETRPLLIDILAKHASESEKSVESFIIRVKHFFQCD